MSAKHANDPLRTTDRDPSVAPPAPEVTTDHAPASSVVDGGTAAYVPGQDTKPKGTVTESGAAVSVPGYEIECVLGRGGMGVVYKARHVALKRTVALKMVLAGGHAGPRELARFRIEAEAVARLQHPNIVQIHEVGEADGHPYCALEFVAGGNLAGKLDGKPIPARVAAKLVEALARAMQLAHSRNVVHRDLKPANVLLAADGTPKITDFGLARQLDSDSGETQAGTVMGTPSYMAPEQASGRAHEAGPAADIYALGAILYDCLTGRPPFKGKSVVETLDQVRTQEPVPPSHGQASVPLDLETICLKCLRKEPENRYASAAELADELVRYLNGEPILARPVGQVERVWRWCVRKPALAGMAVGLAAVIVCAFTVVVWQLNATTAALAREEYEKEQRKLAEKERALAQVNALRDAAPGAVHGILANLDANRDAVLPQLRTRFAGEVDQPKRMRLALALLSVEPEMVRNDLTAWMLQADDPAEVLLVREALAPHKGALLDRLWAAVEKTGRGTAPQRFRAAAALAKFDPESERWAKAAGPVVEQLVGENPVFLGLWMDGFRPIKGKLLPALANIYRDANRRESERILATNILADYAADQPQVLADLLMDADEKQFAVIYPVVEKRKVDCLAGLGVEIDKQVQLAVVKDKIVFESKGTIADDDPKVKPLLNAAMPAKRYEVRLQGGKKYRLTMDSKELDSFLVLQDKTGKELAFDDDGGGDLNSLLVYTPERDDAYRVFAASFKGTGLFQLRVVETFVGDGDDGKEKLAKRQANAAVALLRMIQPAKVWPLLKHSPDPRARSYLIHRLSPLGADARAIVKHLDKETDITIRRALLLSLGEFKETDFTLDERQAVLPKVQEMYRSASDPGLHAASEWLLRTWRQEAWLTQVNQEWAKDGEGRDKRIAGIKKELASRAALAAGLNQVPPQWYVNTQGQTFVVIPGPVEFLMGSPKTEKDREEREQQHKRRIGRSFAIASKSVTLAQYRSLTQDRYEIGEKFTHSPDLPVVGINWYMAAKYCNLLSKEEGIPKEQWCYETGANGEVTMLKANYLSLTGYRLPTEAEMEYATRAGVATSRYYGETEELLGNYAWYTKNSGNLLQRVGMKKPNDFGLFDVQGNCYTWCQEPASEYPRAEDNEAVEDKEVPKDELMIVNTVMRRLRGGSFANLPSVVRSSDRYLDMPMPRSYSDGFRLARTFAPTATTPRTSSSPKVEPRKILEQARGHAGRREWQKAAQAYAAIIDGPVADSWGHVAFEYAAVLLLTGDRPGYQKICAKLVERCGQPDVRSYHVARACALAPGSFTPAERPGELARAELKDAGRTYWSLWLQGALHYRAGRDADAVTALQKSRNDKSIRADGVAATGLWLALTHHRLNQPDEARREFEQAEEWLAKLPDGLPPDSESRLRVHLHNWLEVQVLRLEVGPLLRPGPKKDQ